MIYFKEDTHEYFYDGVRLPSVTQLVSAFYGNSYENVSRELLERSSQYGSLVHNEIHNVLIDEKFEPKTIEAKTFKDKIIKEFCIKYILTEQEVAIELNNSVVACGTLDMLAYFNNSLVLVDFKTTSTIHTQEVIMQLNLYYRGLQNFFKEIADFLSLDLSKIKLAVLQLKGETYTIKLLPLLSDNEIDNKIEIALRKYEEISKAN